MLYERSGALMERKFSEYLIPSILTSAAVSLANVANSIIVGNLLGETALSAIGVSLPVVYAINAFSLLFVVGGAICASIAGGRRETDKANHIFTLTFVVGMSFMFALLAASLLFIRPIAYTLARGNATLVNVTLSYITPLVFLGPVMLLIFGMAQFIRADGKPRVAAWIVIAASLFNVILTYVLIRFLDTGIAGAGLARVLGYLAAAFALVPYLRSGQRTFRFIKPRKSDFGQIWQITGVGLPKALAQGMTSLRILMLNILIVSSLGAPGMAAMALCSSAMMIAVIFVSGTTDTLLPIVGTLYGEKDHAGIRFTVRRGFLFLIAATTALMTLFLVMPGQVGRLFGIVSAEGIAVATPALRMYALSLPVYGCNLLLQSFFQITGRAKLASLMTTLNGFVFVVMFATLIAGLNGEFIWLAFLLAELATLLVVLGLSVRIRKKEDANGMLLLRGECGDGIAADFSIPATVEASAGLSGQVVRFCRENGVDESGAARIGVAIEEMAVNTSLYGHKNKKGVIDVFVRIMEQELILRLRDNGVPFNPAHYRSSENEEFTIEGIELVRRLAKNIVYTRQLGFNVTIITVLRNSGWEAAN